MSGTILRDPDEHVKLLGVTPEAQQICDEIAARRCQYVDQPYADLRVRRVVAAEWCPFGCTEHEGKWREIHPSAVATARQGVCYAGYNWREATLA